MAGSRLEKIGTIFSRASGLLRTGVMKVQDKPIWYDVYALHPPAEEPRYDRPAPNIEIRDIFYEEDRLRAKLHKKVTGYQLGTVKLNDRRNQSATQTFIDQYKNYQAQGALDDEKIFEVALEQMPKSKVMPSQGATVRSNKHSSEAYVGIDDLDLVGFEEAQMNPTEAATETKHRDSLKRYVDLDSAGSEEGAPDTPLQTADAKPNGDAKSRKPSIDVASLLDEKDDDPKKKNE